MAHLRPLLALLPALLPAAAFAQSATPPQDGPGILVEGRLVTRQGNKPIPMSSWRVAETEHVLVYAPAESERLAKLAHNLEKLHFLLSMLLGRVETQDDTLKLRVTLIGDIPDFEQLDLTNTRWQYGPFPKAFPSQRYYDPREDGAVLASTRVPQEIVLRQSRDLRTLEMIEAGGKRSMEGFGGTLIPVTKIDGISFETPADGRFYATYAQHYLMTYFPAAYPRWYLDGFGEIFATLAADQDGVIEYGRAPEGFKDVIEWYGRYPLEKLLDGSYLTEQRRRPRWTPHHAWALAHMLFFSEEWREPLRAYLTAVARGEPHEQAGRALGDIGKLRAALFAYRGAKVPYEQLVYPPDRAPPPLVRQLTRSEAAYVKGKLELGARLDIPPPPPPGADPETAARIEAERDKAVAARERWLADQRDVAARFPDDLDVQLLVAEAECRSGNNDACIAAADRVLAVAPKRPAALVWKGIAMTQQALAGPAAQRDERLKAARALIVRANRGDPDSVVPLLAYYRSFAGAGQAPGEAAVRGLMKANDSVPSAPATQLMLGEALAGRGEAVGARRALRPVAHGAYESPEKPKAKQVLATLPE